MVASTRQTSGNFKVNYCAPTNPNKDSCVPVKVTGVTLNLFFDGTNNNYYNTDATTSVNKDMSYDNAYTNVAHLYTNRDAQRIPDQVWVYMEGIGTEKGKYTHETNTTVSSRKDDSTIGFALGSGGTGIKTRVEEAFEKIKTQFEKVWGKGSIPTNLTINVFGFSRGAAAARHFIYMAKKNPKLFKGWDLSKSSIRFRLVGIFDTVSSFLTLGPKQIPAFLVAPLTTAGISKVVRDKFDNDVGELGLNFSNLDGADKSMTRVFHIVAADEFREFFSVTNINSAVNGGFGCEVTMNGAHSDIGGSYIDGRGDSYDIEYEDTTMKKWLIDKGFYIDKTEIQLRGTKESNYYYHAERKSIKNDLHKISLKMMRIVAEIKGNCPFKSTIYRKENSAPQDLKDDYVSKIAIIDKSVKDGTLWTANKRLDFTFVDDIGITRNFRHKYVHLSAQYTKGSMKDFGYGIRRDDKTNKPIRKNISG